MLNLASGTSPVDDWSLEHRWLFLFELVHNVKWNLDFSLYREMSKYLLHSSLCPPTPCSLNTTVAV